VRPAMLDLDHYTAARTRAVWLERPARHRLWLTGRDRGSYLQGLLTNDIKALEAGRGCYAAYLTPQGRMIADMRLYEVGDGLLMTLPARVAEDVLTRLRQFVFSEDVEVDDRTAALAQIGLHGPAAAAVLARTFHDAGRGAAWFAGFVTFQNTRLPLGAGNVLVAATDELGSGFDLFVDHHELAALCSALEAAGAVGGGPDLAEVLRIEAGRPEFGVDMDADTIPLEAGIENRAISFTKGCYVGQEVIVRVVQRGHGRVARRLVGLMLAEDADRSVPPAGAAILAEARDVGGLTSAVWSPGLDRVIGLGYVRREFAEPGTTLSVVVGARSSAAVVTAPPFLVA
jgi:folate-binding protein YgfZ